MIKSLKYLSEICSKYKSVSEQKSKQIEIAFQLFTLNSILSFTKALQNEKEDEDDEQPIDETKKSITINKKLSNERVSKSE